MFSITLIVILYTSLNVAVAVRKDKLPVFITNHPNFKQFEKQIDSPKAIPLESKFRDLLSFDQSLCNLKLLCDIAANDNDVIHRKNIETHLHLKTIVPLLFVHDNKLHAQLERLTRNTSSLVENQSEWSKKGQLESGYDNNTIYVRSYFSKGGIATWIGINPVTPTLNEAFLKRNSFTRFLGGKRVQDGERKEHKGWRYIASYMFHEAFVDGFKRGIMHCRKHYHKCKMAAKEIVKFKDNVYSAPELRL